jgi:excisionase family DNA binding protein
MAAVAHRPLTRADIMRASDVAELVGIPVSTVYAYARSGQLPHRRRGKHLLFLRWEVEGWLCTPDAGPRQR